MQGEGGAGAGLGLSCAAVNGRYFRLPRTDIIPLWPSLLPQTLIDGLHNQGVYQMLAAPGYGVLES